MASLSPSSTHLSPSNPISDESSSLENARQADTEKTEVESREPYQSNGDNGPQTEHKLKGVSWFLVILVVLSPTFLYALDNTVMANVRPSIIDTFGHIDMLTWLSVSYPMGEVGANPLWFVSI
jgi:hypothetical protein